MRTSTIVMSLATVAASASAMCAVAPLSLSAAFLMPMVVLIAVGLAAGSEPAVTRQPAPNRQTGRLIKFPGRLQHGETG